MKRFEAPLYAARLELEEETSLVGADLVGLRQRGCIPYNVAGSDRKHSVTIRCRNWGQQAE
jgi:hypothetical protein